eukprot:scaffold421183_cov56-Attheya_sp.AAC.3
MPTRVTFRVKRGSSLPVHERAKKQRATNVPRIRVKSEIVTTVEDVTVKTEQIDDGSTGELVQERNPLPKKQRTSHIPSIRIKSEIVSTVEEVTVKTKENNDGSPPGELLFLELWKTLIHDQKINFLQNQNLTGDGDIIALFFCYFFNMINIACAQSASESALCEPSYDPHLSHSASPSSTTSKQCTSQVGTSGNAEMCAFEGRLEGDLVDSISNQHSENLSMNNAFSENQSKEELEYEEVAQNSTTHRPAAMPFVLNKKRKNKSQAGMKGSRNLSISKQSMDIQMFVKTPDHSEIGSILSEKHSVD